MTPVYNLLHYKMIRLSIVLSLIFFVHLLPSCKEKKPEEISLIWKDNQAIGISIPKSFLPGRGVDSLHTHLQVRLESKNPISILGEHNIGTDYVVFKPLIAFSRGLEYEILFRDHPIGKIKIPSPNGLEAPTLIGMFPTQDTFPENLLKIYLQFSTPMREGESLKHISLLNNRNDTLPDVFLNLQPELWNKESTVLTIWLDPGRIKRDLVPNQQKGNPLKKGERYTLTISSAWKDVQGLPLAQSFSRQFVVNSRDSLSPDPDHWLLNIPQAGTKQPLDINLEESLDYFLLQETIQVVDENGNVVNGAIQILDEETKISMIPGSLWLPGRYRLQVASYLEDMAGNNLIKVFDRDITLKQPKTDKKNYERIFIIKP